MSDLTHGDVGRGNSPTSADAHLSHEALPIGLLPPEFETEYVAGAVAPFVLSGQYVGERPALPMIDLTFSKQYAVEPHIWGLLYDGWEPNGDEDGIALFLQGYEYRGPNNARKRIYLSATSPDLIATKYHHKLTRFFDDLFADGNAGKPLMKQFYDSYFDMYWDLHLGVRGEAIPAEVREFGSSFTAFLGFWYPTSEVVHEHYMRARRTRQPLKDWVDARVQDMIDGKVSNADQTFVHYWLKNGGLGENFRRKDIVFECFHNFLAFSQWGNTAFNVMARLLPEDENNTVRSWFERTMTGDPDVSDGGAFTPLDRFVMELMRTISPNAGSASVPPRNQDLRGAQSTTVVTPHPATSQDPRHWTNPCEFDPDRYKNAPTTVDNDETKVKQAGLARCPFPRESFDVKDGRDAHIENSAFGAAYATVEGHAFALCDTAGYAPFGFGYRRCGGEYLTVEFIKELLRKAWRDGISFDKLDLDNPERLPVGPRIVIDDDIAFRRGACTQ